MATQALVWHLSAVVPPVTAAFESIYTQEAHSTEHELEISLSCLLILRYFRKFKAGENLYVNIDLTDTEAEYNLSAC